MYLEYFGMESYPFSLTPNTHFYANLPRHQQCLQLAITSLEQGEGLVKITGEVGTGKTLLCRQLLNSLSQDRFYTAYIPNPYLSPAELRFSLAQELGLGVSGHTSDKVLLDAIFQRLLELAQQRLQVVLVVDEAQAMHPETLEALRLLTNLETEERKLMQVILFGQPELDYRLEQHNMRQLKQRITFSGYLCPLNLAETQQYIHHRLSQAGYNGELLFAPDTFALIQRRTGGIARLINIVCHKALLLAYGSDRGQVDKRMIVRAIDDTDSIDRSSFAWLTRAFKAS